MFKYKGRWHLSQDGASVLAGRFEVGEFESLEDRRGGILGGSGGESPCVS